MLCPPSFPELSRWKGDDDTMCCFIVAGVYWSWYLCIDRDIYVLLFYKCRFVRLSKHAAVAYIFGHTNRCMPHSHPEWIAARAYIFFIFCKSNRKERQSSGLPAAINLQHHQNHGLICTLNVDFLLLLQTWRPGKMSLTQDIGSTLTWYKPSWYWTLITQLDTAI